MAARSDACCECVCGISAQAAPARLRCPSLSLSLSPSDPDQASPACRCVAANSQMGGRGIILKVAQVSGIGADLTGGARVVAVCLTGEWAPAGAATAQRFASVFTLLPPAAAGAQPLVKNHIHRASTADSQAPNVPPSHAPIQDFVGKFIGAFDGAASGEARAAALGFAYADGVSMTFEQDEFAGKEAALRKLASLPAGKHKPCTVDVHPITASASVAFVTGQLVLEEHPMFYVQAIFLAATPAGSQAPYIIVGDMFQFNYA